jgi:hypothetical protein
MRQFLSLWGQGPTNFTLPTIQLHVTKLLSLHHQSNSAKFYLNPLHLVDYLNAPQIEEILYST